MDTSKCEVRGCVKWVLLLNIIYFVVFVCLFRPYFETNDDSAMRMIAVGGGGYYDSHLVFINILLGKFLVFLETCFFIGNWYTVLQVFIVFLSLCAVTYVLIKNSGMKNGIWISMALLTFFGYEGYTAIQFTKTAGFASAAGMMLFLYAVNNEKNKNSFTCYVIAIILVILGSMMRFNMALVAIVVFAGILFVKQVKNIVEKVDSGAGKYRRWLFLAVMLVLVFGCRAYDKNCYREHEGWNKYVEFNRLRASLTDYGYPDYDENQDLYEEIGWTKEDFKYYRTWNFADPDKFNIQTLKALTAAKQKREINVSMIKEFFCIFAERSMTYIPFYIGILFLMIYILTADRSSVRIILYIGGIAILFNFYLFYRGRYFMHRVDIAFLFIIICCMFFYWRPVLFRKSAIILCMGLVLLANSITYESKKVEPETVTAARNLIETLAKDEEHLYVAPILSLRSDVAYGACDAVPFGAVKNMISLGGWKTESPLHDDILENYGVQNIYRDIVNNDRIYLVSYQSVPKSTLAYIQNNYAREAYLTEEKRIGEYYVFAVREEGLDDQ